MLVVFFFPSTGIITPLAHVMIVTCCNLHWWCLVTHAWRQSDVLFAMQCIKHSHRIKLLHGQLFRRVGKREDDETGWGPGCPGLSDWSLLCSSGYGCTNCKQCSWLGRLCPYSYFWKTEQVVVSSVHLLLAKSFSPSLLAVWPWAELQRQLSRTVHRSIPSDGRRWSDSPARVSASPSAGAAMQLSRSGNRQGSGGYMYARLSRTRSLLSRIIHAA